MIASKNWNLNFDFTKKEILAFLGISALVGVAIASLLFGGPVLGAFNLPI